MIGKMKKVFWRVSSLCIFACIFLTISVSVIAQKDTKLKKPTTCKVDSKSRLKYNLVWVYQTTLPPNSLSIDIVVKPKYFTKEHMTTLLNMLTDLYCNYDDVGVAI
jgi:hypothetical protein